MKTVFSAGPVQKILIDKCNAPVVTFLNAMHKLVPKPTKENTSHPNSHILIDLRGRFLNHLGYARRNALEAIINFAIIKYDYDSFYRGCVDWLLKQWLTTNWQLPDGEPPSSAPVCWEVIPAPIRARLRASILENYELLQTRLATIQENHGDSDVGQEYRNSRHDQFVNRILKDVEREVLTWKT